MNEIKELRAKLKALKKEAFELDRQYRVAILRRQVFEQEMMNAKRRQNLTEYRGSLPVSSDEDDHGCESPTEMDIVQLGLRVVR